MQATLPSTAVRMRWPLAGVTLAVAALCVALPFLALGGVALVWVVCLVLPPASARVVAWLGGALVLVATVRFGLEMAAPGRLERAPHSEEERAVSRLQEVCWAEQMAQQAALVDADRDGQPEYVWLDALMRPAPQAGGNPLLNPGAFAPLPPQPDGSLLFRAEGYLFQVWLPASGGGWVGAGGDAPDMDGAERQWLAYAWPLRAGAERLKAFVVNQDARICVSDNTQGYRGVDHPPPVMAGIIQAPDETGCGVGGDGATWRRWEWHTGRSDNQVDDAR